MTILRPSPLQSNQFTWIGKDRTFIADISDFGKGWAFGQVFDDSVDEGLTLYSSKYPERDPIVFVVSHIERNRSCAPDHDLIWWDLVPVTTLTRDKVPEFSIRIFND